MTKREESNAVPTYDYRCEAGHRYERREPFGSPTEHPCEKCGRPAKRQLAAPPIVFKGSGWYVNDSRGDTKPGWGKNSSLYEDDGAESADGGDDDASAERKPRRDKAASGAAKAPADAPAASSDGTSPRRTASKQAPSEPVSRKAASSKLASKPPRAGKAATPADG